MKIGVSISVMTVVAMVLTSCSSFVELGKRPSWSNDVYGNRQKIAATVDAANSQQNTSVANNNRPDLDNLEKRYADMTLPDTAAQAADSNQVAQNENPYERLLSNSYRESYERRLRGFNDPYYRMNNFNVYYSDDFWYAQAYDPAFYNVVVMGNQVWVEPRYISNAFSWPRYNYYFGWNWGWGYGYPYWSWHNYWGYGYPYNYYSLWYPGFGCGYPYYDPYLYRATYNPRRDYRSDNFARNRVASTGSPLMHARQTSTRAASIGARGVSATRVNAAENGRQQNGVTRGAFGTRTATYQTIAGGNRQDPPSTNTSTTVRNGRFSITEPTRGQNNTFNNTQTRSFKPSGSGNNVHNQRYNAPSTGTSNSRGTYNTPRKVYNPGNYNTYPNQNTNTRSNSQPSNNTRSYTPSNNNSTHNSSNNMRSTSNSSSYSRSSSSAGQSSSRSSGSTSTRSTSSTRR